MTEQKQITTIIVAGGRGTRMGGDKLSQQMGKETLLTRVLKQVSQIGEETLLVLAEGQTATLPSQLTIRTVHDIYPRKGALGGLHAGMSASSYPHSLVVAGDMPFLNLKLLEGMIELIPGYDAVVPKIDGQAHPLHAVYSKAKCLPVIIEQLEQGNLRVMDLLELLHIRYVTEKEIEAFDPQRLSLFNINTHADLAMARELVEREERYSD